MNGRQFWLFGLTSLGVVLALPVQAAPNFLRGPFIHVEQSRGGETRRQRQESGDTREEGPAENSRRRSAAQNAPADEPQEYGYGYERRHQYRQEDRSGSRGRR